MESLSIKKRSKTIHQFINDNGEKFVGIVYDFVRKYNLQESKICNVLKGKRNHHKGWRHIVDENDVVIEKPRYEFVNLDGREFTGNSVEFAEMAKCPIEKSCRLIARKFRFVDGWRLKNLE